MPGAATRTGPHAEPDPRLTALGRDLSGRTPAELDRLLSLRPDLIAAAPASLEQLSLLCASRASVHEAVLGLDRAELDALERAVVAGPETAANSPGIAGLRDRALICAPPAPHSSTAWTLTPGAELALGRHPAGLGRPVAQLRAERASTGARPGETWVRPGEPVDLRGVPAPAREVLARFAGRPLGSLRDAARPPDAGAPEARPVDWLLARDLLIAVDARHVEAPREVGLALRGDPWAGHPPRMPVPRGPAVSARLRDNASAAAVVELVRGLRELRAELRGRPLEVLRAGGVGVRERRRLAAALGARLEVSDRLLGFALLAGLIEQREHDEAWQPSAGPFEALDIPTAHGHVLACWWDAELIPAAVGSARTDGSVIVPLTAGAAFEHAPHLRDAVVGALAATQDAAPTEDEVLVAAQWLRPRIAQMVRHQGGAILRECTDLGLTGAGAGTDLLQALREAGLQAVTERLRQRIAAPVETLVFQQDLTAAARGGLTPRAERDMRLVAEREGRGAAATYRLSPASLHRALDAGHDEASVLELLGTRSEAPLPEAVRDAVREAARSHGSLRLLRAEQVVTGRADLVEAVAASSALKGLETVRVSPEVLLLRGPTGAGRTDGGRAAVAARRAAAAVGVQPALEHRGEPALEEVAAEDPGELAPLFPVPPPRRRRPRREDLEAVLARLVPAAGAQERKAQEPDAQPPDET